MNRMGDGRHLAIEAVVFDLDGTLLDTERQANRGWAAVARELGQALSDETLLRCVGVDETGTGAILQEALGGGHDMRAQLERRRQITRAWEDRDGVPMLPGAREIVAWCAQRRWPLAIATSSERGSTERKLRLSGLQPHFHAVCTRDDVTHGKPHPEIYLLAARRLGVAPARCLAFEDSGHGARSALAAGMTVIVVPDLSPTPPDVATAAYAVLDSLHQAPDLLAPRLAPLV